MLGMSADNEQPRKVAEEDIYEPHPSGIGKVLVAKRGQHLPLGYEVTPVTVDVNPPAPEKPKAVNKAKPKAANKSKTPNETKD